MTYITSIGLDVHARSVSACAFDPFTGEVAQRRFGTDAGEIAEWILGFESPKAVYESGAFSQVRIDRMICRKSTLRSRG